MLSKNILNEVSNVNLRARTVKQIFVDDGLFACWPAKKPFMSNKNKKIKLEFVLSIETLNNKKLKKKLISEFHIISVDPNITVLI